MLMELDAKNANRGRIRVAILEDDEYELIGYTAQLANEPDIEVVASASDPEGFSERVKDTRAQVVVVDLRMAIYDGTEKSVYELEGYKFLKTIKEKLPSVKCLVMTALDGVRELVACMDVGAEGFARKGFRPPRQPSLSEIIRTLAAGTPYYPSDLSYKMHEILDRGRLGEENHSGPTPQNPLTNRQREVLALAGPGIMTQFEVAKTLGIEETTVGTHLANIYAVLGVHDVRSAHRIALANGWLEPASAKSATVTDN